MKQYTRSVRLYQWMGILFSLLTVACSDTPSSSAVRVVEVAIVQKGDIQESITLTGTIQAKKKVVLTAKSSGTLQYVAQTGDVVKKDALIAKLGNSEIEQSRITAQETAQLAKQQYDQIQQLKQENAANSDQDIQDSTRAWLEAKNALAQANIAWEETRFLAPFDAVVGAYASNEGAQLQAGDPVVTLHDASQSYIALDIPSKFIQYLKIKQPVMVQDQPAVLTSFQKMVDSDTRTVPATVDFTCSGCLIGELVPVQVPIQIHHAVYWVPTGAVFQQEGKSYVYLVQDNILKKIKVKPGLQEKARLEIVSGLKEGDVVVVKAQDTLQPGMTVEVAEAPEIPAQPPIIQEE